MFKILLICILVIYCTYDVDCKKKRIKAGNLLGHGEGGALQLNLKEYLKKNKVVYHDNLNGGDNNNSKHYSKSKKRGHKKSRKHYSSDDDDDQDDHSHTLAHHSEHKIEVIKHKSKGHHKEPTYVEVGHGVQPVVMNFKTHSNQVITHQKHLGLKGHHQSSHSQDEPHVLVHEVTRPVIQEVKEIIVPERHVTQEIKPVHENVNTIVAQHAPHGVHGGLDGHVLGHDPHGNVVVDHGHALVVDHSKGHGGGHGHGAVVVDHGVALVDGHGHGHGGHGVVAVDQTHGPALVLDHTKGHLPHVGHGPVVVDHGLAVVGHGKGHIGHGPVVVDHGLAVVGHGKGHIGHGPVVVDHGLALVGHGNEHIAHAPVIVDHGPALLGHGHLLSPGHHGSVHGYTKDLLGHGGGHQSLFLSGGLGHGGSIVSHFDKGLGHGIGHGPVIVDHGLALVGGHGHGHGYHKPDIVGKVIGGHR